jgi:hypothetical protein
MANYTQNLNLYKIDPLNDGNKTFNINAMLNDNWDKIDIKHKEQETRINQNTDKITVLKSIHKAIGTTNLIVTTNANFIYSDRNIIKIEVSTLQTGSITINIDNKGSKAIYDIDNARITSLEKGVYELFYDGTNDFFVQRPNGLAKKKERAYQRKVANLSAVADIYDDRTVGATGVWYDLLDGTNDYSRGQLDTTKTNLTESISVGETDLTNKVVSTIGFKKGQEITIQDDVNKENVVVNLETIVDSLQDVELSNNQLGFIDIYDYSYSCAKGNYGTLYLIYKKSSDNTAYCYYSENDGVSWKTIKEINIYNQYIRKMIVDKNENIHVFCYGQNANQQYSQYQINHIMYNGSSWSDWNELSKVSTHSNYNPDAVCDSNNVIHVVWGGEDEKHPETFQIRYAKFTNNTWSLAVSLTDEAKTQQQPSIAIDSNDKLHVVWAGVDSSSSKYQIKYSQHNGVNWSSWINLGSSGGYSKFTPNITLNSNNNPLVVCRGTDSSHTTIDQIKYIKYEENSWSDWVNLTDDNTHPSQNPKAKFDHLNNLHVIWRQGDSQAQGRSRIKHKKRIGQTWHSTVNITISTTKSYLYGFFIDNIDVFENPPIIYKNDTDNRLYIYGKYKTDKAVEHLKITPTQKAYKKNALVYRSNVNVDKDKSLMTIGGLDNTPLLNADVRYNISSDSPINEVVGWVDHQDNDLVVDAEFSIQNDGEDESFKSMNKTINDLGSTHEDEFVGKNGEKKDNATVKFTLTRTDVNNNSAITKILGAIGE